MRVLIGLLVDEILYFDFGGKDEVVGLLLYSFDIKYSISHTNCSASCWCLWVIVSEVEEHVASYIV